MRQIRLLTLTVILLLLLGCLSGCVRQNVILVPPGEPVQIAEPIQARVFVTVNGKKIMSDNKVEIAVGWWALADPGE